MTSDLKESRPGVLSLGYHELSETESRDVYELTPAALRAQLALVAEAARRWDRRVEVTFDDAHRSQVELATTVLAQVGLRAIFFAPAAWVGVRADTATWAQLKEMIDAGHTIGSHGLTHALLTQCSEVKLAEELKRSRDTLQQALGVVVDRISAPGGRWNTRVADACAEAGYESLYTSAPTGGGRFRRRLGLVVQGRLVVRRTMAVTLPAAYVGQSRGVVLRLNGEYALKQGLHRMLGDKHYQAIWRRLVRSPTTCC